MSFWQSRTGREITGDEQSSFVGNFRAIPDNTVVTAIIKNFSMQTSQIGEMYHQIVWTLVDGDFAGAEVKQSLNTQQQNDAKAQRALNMFMRVLKLCNVTLAHNDTPNDGDLAPCKGKILCIKIGNTVIEGRDITYVKEVHKEGALATITGETKPQKVVTSTPELPGGDSALTSYSRAKEGDVPF